MFAYLELHALTRDGVIGRVTGVIPVIDQRTPHGSRLPPEIAGVGDSRSWWWTWQLSWNLTRQIAGVVGHHVESNGACHGLDGTCIVHQPIVLRTRPDMRGVGAHHLMSNRGRCRQLHDYRPGARAAATILSKAPWSVHYLTALSGPDERVNPEPETSVDVVRIGSMRSLNDVLCGGWVDGC